MQAPVPIESVRALAGSGAVSPGEFSSAVEVHYLPGCTENGLLILQQRAHCEDGMDEVAAMDITKTCLALGASGLLVIGGTDASLRNDDALAGAGGDAASKFASKSLLLVTSAPSGTSSNDDDDAGPPSSAGVEMPSWVVSPAEESPAAGAAGRLAERGIEVRGPAEAKARIQKDKSIRASARDAGQVRAGDREALELGVAGLAEASAWDLPSASAAPASGGGSAGRAPPAGADAARGLEAAAAEVGLLFHGTDLTGLAHRVMRQAAARAASSDDKREGAAWKGACALLRYTYEGKNLEDAVALAEDAVAVVEEMTRAPDAESNLVAGHGVRSAFSPKLRVPGPLAKSAEPSALDVVNARRVSLL